MLRSFNAEIHAFLMQIKIKRARPLNFMCMKLIFDLKASLEKICSLLGKSAQTCAEIAYHVLDAEREIKRIEQQLRNGAPVAGDIDLTPRIAQRTAKKGEDGSPVQVLVANTKAVRGAPG